MDESILAFKPGLDDSFEIVFSSSMVYYSIFPLRAVVTPSIYTLTGTKTYFDPPRV